MPTLRDPADPGAFAAFGRAPGDPAPIPIPCRVCGLRTLWRYFGRRFAGVPVCDDCLTDLALEAKLAGETPTPIGDTAA